MPSIVGKEGENKNPVKIRKKATNSKDIAIMTIMIQFKHHHDDDRGKNNADYIQV